MTGSCANQHLTLNSNPTDHLSKRDNTCVLREVQRVHLITGPGHHSLPFECGSPPGLPVHRYFGRYVDQTQSYDFGIALVGLTPLVGYAALRLFWDSPKEKLQKQGGG